ARHPPGRSGGPSATRGWPRMSRQRLAGRFVALGVTGSIAAYKAVELLRLLQAEGADVAVLMTPAATAFVGPLTFEALSRHAVDRDVLALAPDGRIGHVIVADAADAVVVAPATAHWLAAMAIGLAGDSVTATCLATAAPVVVAPAMDGEMYAHPATRANVARLRETFGYSIVEPEAGALASGQAGVGRLAALGSIVEAVVAAIADRPVRTPDPAARLPFLPTPAANVPGDGGPARRDLGGRHLVVTAGGTAEPIDPVRFIGNRSTGRMGIAVAEAALARGARVTLIAGQVTAPLPSGPDLRIVRAETTALMRAALLDALGGSDGASGFDALVMAAAVADFRPARPAETKLVRGEHLALALEPTPDLLAEVSRIARGLDADGVAGNRPLEPRPVLVGFAAETGSLARAPDKLARKGLDLLVANDVSEAGSGFGTETNRVTVYSRDGEPDGDAWPLLSKREVADRLLDLVAGLLGAGIGDDTTTNGQAGSVAEEAPR
ncbi:MAG TPA: bifunctional phosphopantothenoylcysteine decarboxylase/phosphopantothenate synthase, partial [Candidatus Limnocylindrales bacterium]